ncbi:MAG: hypothetical protein WAS49_01375 [Candidatus Dechloromonas phosphoritropha]|jgi:hypothetical protein|nr:hypothetical protein [Candidatus Dechloromonas phosphoritropha]MBP8785982.1 hypothetical protein [Azonexus sp.]MBP9226915.1 hypothetical protein [Azonexus sp.]
MRRSAFGTDTFGDRFDLDDLSLPRPPGGYAVQMLDTDTLLDRASGNFLPVRSAKLDGLFASFDDAFAAACRWVEAHCSAPEDHRLAIVPAGFDEVRQRHVLIYGVLCGQP